jgi:hypothetical protein
VPTRILSMKVMGLLPMLVKLQQLLMSLSQTPIQMKICGSNPSAAASSLLGDDAVGSNSPIFSNPGNKSVLTKSSHRQIYPELATASRKGMKLMKNSQPHTTKTGR